MFLNLKNHFKFKKYQKINKKMIKHLNKKKLKIFKNKKNRELILISKNNRKLFKTINHNS